MDWTEIGTALIAALPIIVTTVLGFLTAHKVVSKRSTQKAYQYALLASNAAEELFANQLVSGEVKRQYAQAHIQEKFGVSEAEAEMILHAAVNSLRAIGVKGQREQRTTATEADWANAPAGNVIHNVDDAA